MYFKVLVYFMYVAEFMDIELFLFFYTLQGL